MSKAPLIVAGTIFGLIALIHVYRLYSHFSIVIGTAEIPSWVSLVAVIVAGWLSYWMFSTACDRSCK